MTARIIDNFDAPPPFDAAAEASVLGSLLIAEADLKRELFATLTDAHFFLDENAIVWAAAKALATRGEPIDAVTLRAELLNRGKLDEVGGVGRLGELLTTVPSAANGKHYAAIVLRDARRRALWKIGRDTAIEAWAAGSDPVALAYRHRDRLDALLRKATTPVHREGGALEVATLLEAEAEGRRQCASLPWPLLGRLTKAMLPGTITLLVGDPGAGKTFLLLEALNHWTLNGTPAAALMLEKDRAWHLRRCLALLTGDLRLLDDEAVRNRRDWYCSRPGEYAETLESVGAAVWDSTHAGSTLDEIAAWIDQQVDGGQRMVIVDPISLADTEEKPWIAHDRFMRTARRSIERTGASLILSTHPRGGQKMGPPTIDDLAGSRVFVRRADSILWLRRNALRPAVCLGDLRSDAIRMTCDIDRTVRVLKCRDGSAADIDFGMQWNRNAGGFAERGIVEEWLDEQAADTLPGGL